VDVVDLQKRHGRIEAFQDIPGNLNSREGGNRAILVGRGRAKRVFLTAKEAKGAKKERAQNNLPENEPDRLMEINRGRHQDVMISPISLLSPI
jgi:hypothetical protein